MNPIQRRPAVLILFSLLILGLSADVCPRDLKADIVLLPVRIVQNDRTIEMSNHEFVLARAPFTLIFDLPAGNPQVQISFSLDANTAYVPMAAGRDAVAFEGGNGIAEAVEPPEAYIWIDQDNDPETNASQFWYGDSAENGRFHRVRSSGGILVAERDILYWSGTEEGALFDGQIPPGTIYVGCRNALWNPETFRSTEHARNWFRIRFR